MAGLLQRIEQARAADVARTERRYSADAWFTDYLVPSMNQWGYQGYNGLTTTWVNGKVQEYSATLPGHSAAVRSSPPAFAAQMVRALVISQARFTFRNLPSANQPRKTFGTPALSVLERPWRNATTSEMLARMEWHAGLAGNAYVTNYWPGRLRVLRPDWVAIVYGSDREPEDAAHALDGEVIGYAYINGGMAALGRNDVTVLLPEEVAHWSPIPDPEGAGIGMSWVSAAMRDIIGDKAATDHKVLFFENGATPNLVVKGITATTKAQFDAIVEGLEQRHTGVANAYKTLYLTAGADATVVGSDLKNLDFKATQGAGETRIAMLARVPAPLLGISEGLAGSSLNAGNFGMARRIFADTWIYPNLQDLCASLAPLVNVPSGAELWFDTTDMPILREDAKDAAEIEQIKQTTINGYVREGWEPESAKAAVRAQDISLLKHSGLVSVQLQPPGTTADTMQAGGAGPKVPAGPGRSGDLRKFDPSQPRDPHSGEWSLGGAIAGAIKDVLKLAGKIDLDKDEHLVGSGKVDADFGGFRIAAIDGPDGRAFRIGFGGEGFGQASPDDDLPEWNGNPSTGEFNQTAALDADGIAGLDAITSSFARAADSGEAETFGQGVIPGTEWGDIHWRVYLDDPAAEPDGPELLIGVLPKDDPDWQNGRDWEGYFTPAEWKKIARQIEAMRTH